MNFDGLISTLIFFTLSYVILKHFFSESNSTNSGIESIIINKKRELVGGEKEKLLWDEILFSSRLKFKISEKEVIQLGLSAENPLDKSKEVFQYILREFLRGSKKIEFKNYSIHSFKLYTHLQVNNLSHVFSVFDGSVQSLTEIDIPDFFSVSENDVFLDKFEQMADELERFFLLSEGQIENVKSELSRNELIKRFHPDGLNINLIPRDFQEKFIKIYSDQFSKMIS